MDGLRCVVATLAAMPAWGITMPALISSAANTPADWEDGGVGDDGDEAGENPDPPPGDALDNGLVTSASCSLARPVVTFSSLSRERRTTTLYFTDR